jgi:hypothetical protein
MRNAKKTGSDTPRQQQAIPVERDYVAEVQQRAEQLAETAGDSAAQTESTGTSRRNRHVQEEMARLRSDAIQARRLAEQIEMVSLQNRPSQGTHSMAHSSKQDSGTYQRPEKSTRDTAPAGANRLAFNPLHPSMELPPEQLIRLLGLETKKTRKEGARQSPKRGQEPARRSAIPGAVKPHEQLPPPIRPQRSQAAAAHSRTRSHNSRSSLFLPAMVVGILAGLAASGYFFWNRGAPAASDKNAASAVSEPRPGTLRPVHPATSSATQPPKKGSPESVTGKPAAEPGKPAGGGNVKRAAPTEPRVTSASDPSRQAAVEAEHRRLRAEAEQRFADRLRQSKLKPAPSSAAPVSGTPAAAQPAYPIVAEPETTSSPLGSELEPARDASTPVQPGSHRAAPVATLGRPAEPATDVPAQDSGITLPEPDAAEAPQNPIRQTGTESGLKQLSDGTHDTALAPTQPAVEPVTGQPLTSAPDSQALDTLSSESAPRADAQDTAVAEPAPQAGQPDEGDAQPAKPPLF